MIKIRSLLESRFSFYKVILTFSSIVELENSGSSKNNVIDVAFIRTAFEGISLPDIWVAVVELIE